MRLRSWGILGLPLLLAASLIVGFESDASSHVTPHARRAQSTAGPGLSGADRHYHSDKKTMLASYPGGNTIDKEIRESKPRRDGYRHIDTQKTIRELKRMHANTHYFLMWHSPSDWEDFTDEFLPAARRAGIDVWAYIVPPSECHDNGWCSLPYKTDYIAWAKQIAKLSTNYSNLKGWVIDDFTNGKNGKTFTQDYMKKITSTTRQINPKLKLETIAYYGKAAIDDKFYDKYSPYIDGVILPYRDEPHNNTRRTSTLSKQLTNMLSYTKKYDLETVLMLYTGRYGTFNAPKASYVRNALTTGLEYARQGKIQGIVSYGTPHSRASAVSSENEAMYGKGRLALLAYAGSPAAGAYGAASQTIEVDPKARRYTLNFWTRNRFFGSEPTGARVAEVLIEGHVVWSADIAKKYGGKLNDRWRQSEGPIEIDRSLLRGKRKAKLTFRIKQQEEAESFRSETSFDNMESSGFRVRNSGFETHRKWKMKSTDGTFVPLVDVWHADNPSRVFKVIAKGFRK